MGTWAFDTTSASTSTAFNGGSSFCYSDINLDLFYEWTAPAAGDYEFDTIGSSFDTKMNLHAGAGCTATCVAGDDDSGGALTSKISVTGVNAGDVFLVQVGGFGTSSGQGQLNVTTYVDPCAVNPRISSPPTTPAPLRRPSGTACTRSTSARTSLTTSPSRSPRAAPSTST